MRQNQRALARKNLDAELRHYRRAGMEKKPTNSLLRVAEIAEKMGVCRSVVLDFEAREPQSTASLKSMSRMAEAMGCKVVYGIVPKDGKTLEYLAESRLWMRVMGGETKHW
jgi:hypothetical protein